MDSIYSNYRAYKGSGGLGRYIQTPLAEEEILYLEHICMTPGTHHISVQSFASGRHILTHILKALAWHQDIGYLGVEDLYDTSIQVSNITEALEWPLDQEKLETFFINSFYYDFLWIERSKELYSMPWIEAFEQQLLVYKLDFMIPIIVIEEL